MNTNTAFAYTAEEKCNASCVEKVFAGQMSRAELEYIGYGNVIRAATKADGGEITYTLYLLGLWDYYPAGNVNAVFETNIPMQATFFSLQEDGGIWASTVDVHDNLYIWLCYPHTPCTVIAE